MRFAALGVMLLFVRTVIGNPTGNQDYLVDVWTGDNGLPNSSVTAIAQTPEGYLWIGTHNGLARFDGVRFVVFDPFNTPELKHARIRGLFTDARGTLWINTYDNSLTSWRQGVFRHEFVGQQVSSVFSRSNEVLFATQGGDLILRAGNATGTGVWQTLKAPERTSGATYREDRAGVLWFVTRDGAVGRFVNTNFLALPAEAGLSGRRVTALDIDASGAVWVGTDQGVAVWDGKRFQDRTPTNGDPQLSVAFLFGTGDGGCWVAGNQRVRKLRGQQWVTEAPGWGELFGSHAPALAAYQDRNGGVWFRHFGQGIFHAKPEGTLRHISSNEGLPGDRVTCWFEDREGNVWVGVDRGGLVRLRERQFKVVGVADGRAAQAAMTVAEDEQGSIWIGTYGNGLNRWRDGELECFTLGETPFGGLFFSLYPAAEGRLWLSAGREDFYTFEDGEVRPAPTRIHGIKALLVDRSGTLWIGTARGLSRLNNGAMENFGPNQGIERAYLHALAEDARGHIWAGGGNGVLYEYSDGRFKSFQPDDALQGQTIWSLLPDEDNTIWVGTFRGGLLRFKDGKFTRFTTANGLPSDVICQILDDGMGRLWIGSHGGVFRVSKSALNSAARTTGSVLPCVAYGIHDGLPTLECSGAYQPSAWRSRDGRLWFATFKGVATVQPDQVRENPLAPPVLIEEFLVDGKPVKLPDAELKEAASAPARARSSNERQEAALQIAPGSHYYEILFTALSYVAPDKVRFRYRLRGLEEDWIEAGARRYARYSRLPPGHYRFEVQACNNDNVWNLQGVALAFEVLPHFYQTAWFQALVALGTVGLIAGTVRHFVVRKMRRELEQLERQRAIERERARIAHDIHDDLGAGLTRIMLQSELARRTPSTDMPEHLDHIADMARGLTRTMDEIVWAVDPQHDTLSGLMDYASAFAEDFLAAAGIRCRIDLPSELPPMRLNAELRYHLFLAIKEALNNVVKHAGATEVWLRLRLNPEGFTLVIEDNGRGMVAAGAGEPTRSKSESRSPKPAGGYGLTNLEQRLQAVGGRCLVRSAAGRGTTVEMTVYANAGDPLPGSSEMAMAGDTTTSPE